MRNFPRSGAMTTTETSGRRWGRWAALAVVAAVVVVGGEAFGAVTVVSHPLAGAGNSETATDLTFWAETTVASTTVPSPVPAEASTVSGTATQLASAPTSYAIDAAVAGDPALDLTFVEYPNASRDVYFEIAFTLGTPTGGSILVKIYLQVQSLTGLPTSPQSYSFYYDLGTEASPSGFVVVPVGQVSESCSSRTSCP